MRFLFVCVENSCRSQMAEGFARALGVHARSAGSRPSGVVNRKAIRSMAEVGIDLSAHRSKSLTEAGPGPYDAIVTMGCGDRCDEVDTAHRLEWDIPDPKHLDAERFGAVRERIRAEVERLVHGSP